MTLRQLLGGSAGTIVGAGTILASIVSAQAASYLSRIMRRPRFTMSNAPSAPISGRWAAAFWATTIRRPSWSSAAPPMRQMHAAPTVAAPNPTPARMERAIAKPRQRPIANRPLINTPPARFLRGRRALSPTARRDARHAAPAGRCSCFLGFARVPSLAVRNDAESQVVAPNVLERHFPFRMRRCCANHPLFRLHGSRSASIDPDRMVLSRSGPDAAAKREMVAKSFL
jgi:hypothetical protein